MAISMWSKVRREFDRSPVATVVAPLGLLVGFGAICVGCLQLELARRSAEGGTVSGGSAPHAPGAPPDGSLALVVIGVFLALTPSFALIARMLYRKSRYFAVPASIVIAVLSIFLSRLDATVLGYGVGATGRSAALDEVLFYGTVIVFLAVAGREPLMDLGRPTPATAGDRRVSGEDAVGAVALIVLAVLIWGGLVGWGERRMVAAFLS